MLDRQQISKNYYSTERKQQQNKFNFPNEVISSQRISSPKKQKQIIINKQKKNIHKKQMPNQKNQLLVNNSYEQYFDNNIEKILNINQTNRRYKQRLLRTQSSKQKLQKIQRDKLKKIYEANEANNQVIIHKFESLSLKQSIPNTNYLNLRGIANTKTEFEQNLQYKLQYKKSLEKNGRAFKTQTSSQKYFKNINKLKPIIVGKNNYSSQMILKQRLNIGQRLISTNHKQIQTDDYYPISSYNQLTSYRHKNQNKQSYDIVRNSIQQEYSPDNINLNKKNHNKSIQKQHLKISCKLPLFHSQAKKYFKYNDQGYITQKQMFLRQKIQNQALGKLINFIENGQKIIFQSKTFNKQKSKSLGSKHIFSQLKKQLSKQRMLKPYNYEQKDVKKKVIKNITKQTQQNLYNRKQNYYSPSQLPSKSYLSKNNKIKYNHYSDQNNKNLLNEYQYVSSNQYNNTDRQESPIRSIFKNFGSDAQIKKDLKQLKLKYQKKYNPNQQYYGDINENHQKSKIKQNSLSSQLNKNNKNKSKIKSEIQELVQIYSTQGLAPTPTYKKIKNQGISRIGGLASQGFLSSKNSKISQIKQKQKQKSIQKFKQDSQEQSSSSEKTNQIKSKQNISKSQSNQFSSENNQQKYKRPIRLLRKKSTSSILQQRLETLYNNQIYNQKDNKNVLQTVQTQKINIERKKSQNFIPSMRQISGVQKYHQIKKSRLQSKQSILYRQKNLQQKKTERQLPQIFSRQQINMKKNKQRISLTSINDNNIDLTQQKSKHKNSDDNLQIQSKINVQKSPHSSFKSDMLKLDSNVNLSDVMKQSQNKQKQMKSKIPELSSSLQTSKYKNQSKKQFNINDKKQNQFISSRLLKNSQSRVSIQKSNYDYKNDQKSNYDHKSQHKSLKQQNQFKQTPPLRKVITQKYKQSQYYSQSQTQQFNLLESIQQLIQIQDQLHEQRRQKEHFNQNEKHYEQIIQKIQAHIFSLRQILDIATTATQIYPEDSYWVYKSCFLTLKKYYLQRIKVVDTLKGKSKKSCFKIAQYQITEQQLKPSLLNNVELVKFCKDIQHCNKLTFQLLKYYQIYLRSILKDYSEKQFSLTIFNDHNDLGQLLQEYKAQIIGLQAKNISNKDEEQDQHDQTQQVIKLRIFKLMEVTFMISQLAGKRIKQFQDDIQIEQQFQDYIKDYWPHFQRIVKTFS